MKLLLVFLAVLVLVSAAKKSKGGKGGKPAKSDDGDINYVMCTHDNHKTTTLLQRFKGIGTKIKCIFVPGTEPKLTQKQTITFTLTQLQRIRVHIPSD